MLKEVDDNIPKPFVDYSLPIGTNAYGITLLKINHRRV